VIIVLSLYKLPVPFTLALKVEAGRSSEALAYSQNTTRRTTQMPSTFVLLLLALCWSSLRNFVSDSIPFILTAEPGSSGSIVSDYGLDDRAIGVRFSGGAKVFSSILCVQTGSGAHPASCTMGTGGPFPGGKSAAGA
jgi:hypothetical protein